VTKFRGKYRIQSSRLPGWDYGKNGIYFVTICTKNRCHFFGEIIRGEMELSGIGGIADKCWLKIPEHFPFVILHEHIVMPNHVHGLIEIAKNDMDDDTQCTVDTKSTVETQNFASLHHQTSPPPKSPPPKSPPPYKNQFGPQSKNLSSIIRGIKIGVTKNARLIHPDFQWQPRFHDHTVRNNQSFHRISNYIINNPKHWNKDEFNENQ